jgi:hypothetical protein
MDMQKWKSPGAKALKWLKPEEVDFVKQTVLELRLKRRSLPLS